jgi:hypothetical protein
MGHHDVLSQQLAAETEENHGNLWDRQSPDWDSNLEPLNVGETIILNIKEILFLMLLQQVYKCCGKCVDMCGYQLFHINSWMKSIRISLTWSGTDDFHVSLHFISFVIFCLDILHLPSHCKFFFVSDRKFSFYILTSRKPFYLKLNACFEPAVTPQVKSMWLN